MAKFIIVKYADSRFPRGKAPLNESIHKSNTAELCGVSNSWYYSREAAAADLALMQLANPAVGYGIVEAIEIESKH